MCQRYNMQHTLYSKADKSRETFCKAEKHIAKQSKTKQRFAKQIFAKQRNAKQKHFSKQRNAKQSCKSAASHFSALSSFSICFGSLANKRSLKARIICIICILCIICFGSLAPDGVSPTDIYDLPFAICHQVKTFPVQSRGSI